MGSAAPFVVMKACGPDDPGGHRAASVLAAYFNATRTRTFRQMLWRRLAACATAAWLVESATPLLSRAALVIVLSACVVVGAGAVVAEWRAREAFRDRLSRCPGATWRTSDEAR